METENDNWIGKALRAKYGLLKQPRTPNVGDVVEVDGQIGLCVDHSKGWCIVRQLSDDAPGLDFVVDTDRHGPCNKIWRIRDDL